LQEIIHDRQNFIEEKIKEPGVFNKIAVIKPKYNNERVIRQKGAFFLFGIDKKKKAAPKLPIERVLTIKDGKTKEEQVKSKILCELGKFGVDKGALFPELDKQAEHIVESYKTLG
jgi:hypothetical protein